VCPVLVHHERRLTTDLVVGADGINLVMRECLVGYLDKPIRRGELAHKLLLKAGDTI